MAFIKEISFTYQTSVKIGEYQFAKPTVSMVSVLEEGDSHETVMTSLKKAVMKEMEKIIDEL